MNNARIWLVVKPTVGLPLLLGAVAVSSFAVHLAVLSKTTWYEDYLAGKELGSGAATASLDSSTTLARADGDARKVLVVMPDGSTAQAVLDAPLTHPVSETRSSKLRE